MSNAIPIFPEIPFHMIEQILESGNYMSQLQFHPVWKDKLTLKQKEELLTFFEEQAPITGKFDAVLVRGKYKKNEGAVATVLLRNGYEKLLEIKQAIVEITDSANHLVAAEKFELDLSLKGDSALPWSFVFSRESVKKADVDSANWKIHVDLQEEIQTKKE